MNNDANYQPNGNSDASNGNRGENRPRRSRILNSDRERQRTSFNPNFYRENRPYNPSARTEGRVDGEQQEYRPQQRQPYNPNYSQRNSNYNNNRYNNNQGGGYNREQRNYNSDNRSYNNENREGNPENRENRRYNNNGYNSDNRGFNRNNGGYNNQQNRSGYGQQRPNFQRNNNNQGGYKPKFQKKDGDYNPNAKYSQKKQFEYKQQFVDYSLPMRLNKYIANSSICSRREADEFIQAGVVSVNGNIVTELGTKIIPATDKVMFHDHPVNMQKKVYILLNKPKNCVTTTDDPQERQTVMDLVKDACTEKIYPVGRLDRNTTGVLLLTNDGDLTSKLTHPKHDKKKIYQVKLDREFEQADMNILLNGIILEDGEMKADEISFPKEDDKKIVGIQIHSGKNRVVRRMLEYLKYRIVGLDRVYFAGLTKQKLPRGKWRFLSEKEVAFLKMNHD